MFRTEIQYEYAERSEQHFGHFGPINCVSVRIKRVVEVTLPDENAMIAFGSELVHALKPHDIVLFYGNLGAGKTTLIRGILQGLGHDDPVRSPTFNLFSLYQTHPPVLHADLYRVSGAIGTGIEDYFDSHLCLIEWPDALAGLVKLEDLPRVEIEYAGAGRRLRLSNISL